MAHGAARLLCGGEAAEGLDFQVKVGTVAAGPPLDGDEGATQRTVAAAGEEAAGRAGEGQAARDGAADAGHVGTAASDGGEEEVLPGVVDDADGGLAVDGEAEGDTGVGEGVDEVGCACRNKSVTHAHHQGDKVSENPTINGVTDKGRFGTNSHARLIRLLAHEGDVWKGSGES